MAKYAGKNLKIFFTPDGGSEEDISGKYRSFDVSETIKLANLTTAENTFEEYTSVDIADAKASYQALDTTDGANPFDVVKQGTAGVLTWAPIGITPGNPKRYANAVVQSRKVNWPYDNAVTLNAEFQITSPTVETVYA